jgi:hypothetical protein
VEVNFLFFIFYFLKGLWRSKLMARDGVQLHVSGLVAVGGLGLGCSPPTLPVAVIMGNEGPYLKHLMVISV